MSATALCFASASSFIGQQSLLNVAFICRRPHQSHNPLPRFSIRRTRAAAADEKPLNKPLVESPAPAIEDEVSVPSSVPEVRLSSDAAPFSDSVPGKIQLTELELAAQKTALDKYTMELRKKQMEEDREAARLFGWVPFAETLNGRLAMFFIVTGVLTEYWTGYTLPQQVELMLRTLGFF